MSIKTNLYVDLAIFGAFLVAFEPHLTGLTIHEWFGLALGAAFIIHVLLHWNWIVAVTRQFFRNPFHVSRLNYLLNSLLLVAFVTIILSGVMISRSVLATFGLAVDPQPAWRFLHSSASNFALLLVGLHVALHWKWILSAVKRYVLGGRTAPAGIPHLGRTVAVPIDEAKR